MSDPNSYPRLGMVQPFGSQEIANLWERPDSRDFILGEDPKQEVLNVAFVKLGKATADQDKDERWYPRLPKLYNQHIKEFFDQTGAVCGYGFIPFPKNVPHHWQDRQIILACYPHDFRDPTTDPMQTDRSIKDKFFAMLVNKGLLDEQVLYGSGVYLGVNHNNITKLITASF